jgi:glycosyltransferase involved in cell wall biosynthesis
MVIHDLNFEHYPQHLPWLISLYYRKFTPRMANAADRIVTVSEFSKSDIFNQYGVDNEKVDVVYNGANPMFSPVQTGIQKSFREKFTQSLPFFLFVGMIHPRKNLAKQLAAFDLFRENAANPPHKFLIVGEKWIIDSELKIVLSSMKFKDDVIFTGRLGVDELSVAAGSATAIMYVSLFEGFGIPILEGYYAETPVITSNVSSMPEVAGDAALCVNPHNASDIAQAMSSLAQDMDLRRMLIERGRKRREEFSWDKSADLMWKAIEKTLNTNH